jgi:hypothetical protein
MKKVLLFGTIAGMVTMYACKKADTVTVTNTVHDTTKTTIIKTDTVTVFASGKINADTLTTGITLAYSAGITGEFPAASTDAAAPVLDTTYSRKYNVIRSRYLTVYPPTVSGFVQGYYVQIVGAKSYFKVDYPAAEVVRKAARQAKLARLAKATNGRQSVKDLSNSRGTGEGFIDSAIVFKLPASIHGDTFYIKYAAYDQQNRVSAPVTAMVVILPAGNAEFTQSLNGSWLKYEYRYLRNGVVQEGGDRIDARDDNGGWSVDTGYTNSTYFTCNNDQLSYANEGAPYFYAYNIYSDKQTYTFGGYGFNQHTRRIYKSWNSELSTCSEMVYNLSYDNIYDDNGGYSYDAASKKITFMWDGYNLEYDTYNVISVSGSEMILSSSDDDDDNEVSQYKYIKQ